ncbi:MAG: hypothetical protein J0M36_11045 [Caulobacterales bacterium]|nr:hypothetical protein [Caulobacterales bacterium]
MPVGSNLLSRRGLVLSASCAVLAVPGVSHAARRVTPNVLFVCRHGTVKSPIARELMRRQAAERGFALTAFSRGLSIEDQVSPGLAQALRADGVDIWSEPRLPLQASDIRAATLVVLFDSLPTAVSKPTRDWTDFPSFNANYARARAELDIRLSRLLDDLQGRAPVSGAAAS